MRRAAACPSHSSAAITEDDRVCSLQEMSLKRMARLLLFVAENITRGGRGSRGDVTLQWY